MRNSHRNRKLIKTYLKYTSKKYEYSKNIYVAFLGKHLLQNLCRTHWHGADSRSKRKGPVNLQLAENCERDVWPKDAKAGPCKHTAPATAKRQMTDGEGGKSPPSWRGWWQQNIWWQLSVFEQWSWWSVACPARGSPDSHKVDGAGCADGRGDSQADGHNRQRGGWASYPRVGCDQNSKASNAFAAEFHNWKDAPQMLQSARG